MKNLLLLLLCLFSIQSYSQTSKGDMGIGGTIGGGFNKSDNFKFFNVSMAPESGYFLFDNFLFGARIAYTYSFDEFMIIPGTLETNHNHRVHLGPLVRYYWPLGSKWRGIAHVGYEWYWNIRIDDNETFKFTDYQLGVGAAFFISENVALEGIFYNQRDQDIIFLGGLQVFILRNRSVMD